MPIDTGGGNPGGFMSRLKTAAPGMINGLAQGYGDPRMKQGNEAAGRNIMQRQMMTPPNAGMVRGPSGPIPGVGSMPPPMASGSMGMGAPSMGPMNPSMGGMMPGGDEMNPSLWQMYNQLSRPNARPMY